MAINHVVEWSAAALDEPAGVWPSAADRNAVSAASHRLERDLARDPYAAGFPRDASVNRTATDFPLGIDCELIEDDKKVRVLRVWSLV